MTDQHKTEVAAPAGPFSRRSFLGGAAALGIAGSLGVKASPTLAQVAVKGPAQKVRIAWTEVALCHAHIAFGAEKGIFAKHNLDAELYFQGASGQTLIQALATDKADVGIGLILDFLKPLEQGFDVKLVAGNHGGCQRLLASKISGIKTIEDFRGKVISVADLAGPAKLAFSVNLAKAGIDPDTGVTWKVFPWDLVGEAVHKGEADALAQFDPWAYSYLKNYDLVQIADAQSGIYQDRVCCVIGVNGPFLKAKRDIVKRVAEASIEAAEYTANHPEEVATYYFDTYKPKLPLKDIVDDLSSMTFHIHPIGNGLIKQVKDSLDDLKLIKVIDADIDTDALAHQFTDNILA